MSWNTQIGPHPVAELAAKLDEAAKDAEGQIKAALEAAKQLVEGGHVGDDHAQVTVYGQEPTDDQHTSHVVVSVASFGAPSHDGAPVPAVSEGSEPPPPSVPTPPAGPETNPAPSAAGDPPAGPDGDVPAAQDEGPDVAVDAHPEASA